LLLDTIGELASLFPMADVVFVGGTLNHRGGHNILEPAQSGRAIVIGPHMENFPEIAADFRQAGALVEVQDTNALAEATARLLEHPAERRELGRIAARVAQAGRGATERCIHRVADLYQHCLPRSPRSWWHYAALWPLARVWAAGAAWKRHRELPQARRLPAAVLCVGNVTMGGAGKTPTVLWLVEQLRARGHQPAILTRGYRRVSRQATLVANPGDRPPRESTGDEAQILLRRGGVPVGIGANRVLAGQAVLQQHPATKVFVLDDGLQHWRLHRDCNLVVVDALQPFGQRDLFPLGRLREPLAEGLSRAHAFLITRTECGASVLGIEQTLRRMHPKAPVFRSRVLALGWVDARTGTTLPPDALQEIPVVAFCGLANPNSFFVTLRAVQVAVKARAPFPDHHPYHPQELKRLDALAAATGAQALVCSEKDIQNLNADWAKSIGDRPLYWLKIGMDVDQPEALVALLCKQLSKEAPPNGDSR
ncbi:MAG: tetraacyldisaccharide 4'-kinase, partial [Bryobacterales bacterium]|nr:tetraacyldisaccharide 4'-kinase [Bryobacterales bacterium]